ncbi:hypothetical protein BDV96DRAFT_649727 [Lophiotrema nucula]|uniref:Ca2+ regulator and membrane fusion protein Fig1-domain-containing protein n=1 Tax=Lophiotrema nucula TaxID=690887 RepID=A0A6A5Z037_9PLEO|nr:hypothetical protein BDV96DRAFT_649727 [Lophiotrema nucula]
MATKQEASVALTLTGCVTTSLGLANLHLSSSRQYYPDPNWILCLACSSTHGVSASQLTSKLSDAGGTTLGSKTSAEIIDFAMTLQKKIFPPLLAASAAIFVVGIIAFLLLQRDMQEGEQVVRGSSIKNLSPRRTERYRKVTIQSFFIASGLALASAVAVAQATDGIQYASENIGKLSLGLEQTNNLLTGNEASLPALVITAGKASQILHWFIVGFLAVFSVSIAKTSDTSFWNIPRNPYLKAEPVPLSGVTGGAAIRAGVPGPPMPIAPPPMVQIPPPPPLMMR